MATDREWATGYFEQASADLLGVKAIGSASPSVAAMLWQMVFEKYAKAALLRQGAVPRSTITKSHKAASRMLGSLRRQPKVFAALGGAKLWEDVLGVIGALESAHPQLAPPVGPQLEYPWENTRGDIQWPERDLQVARAIGDAKRGLSPRLLRFAALLGRHFDAMFP